MSNGLAIAATTRVLQDLLQSGLVAANIGGAVGGNIIVTALPPDRILNGNGGNEASQLNLFLHQVTPNVAWSNRDLPTRDSRSARVADSLLALNLHYLLTAYSDEELQGEILLGHAMQLLHEHAILRRAFIRDTLTNPPGGGMGPVATRALVNAALADQLELIKTTLQPLSMDEMSKLWTAFQSHYRTSAAYEVTVVLIDRQRPKRTPLPVLTRGIVVRPYLVPPVPTLTSIAPPRRQVAARLGEEIVLLGHHLSSDQVRVRFREERDGAELILPALTATDGRVTVALPDPPPLPLAPPPQVAADSPINPANWQAAVYRISLLIRDAAGQERATNALPLVLAPLIQNINPVRAGVTVTFNVLCSPPVRRSQDAALIIGSRELPAQPLTTQQATTLIFPGTGFAVGDRFAVRLRVAGIDSILIDRQARPPAFDPTQVVVIP